MIAPTIIIGLGGIGSEICCNVSKLVRDEAQRKRLRFVCIDTDINDLRQRQAADPSIITIQTSAPYTVGDYLKVNTVARDEWFPTHAILDGKTPTEGAGQVRAISRLAFDTTVREGKLDALEQAIEELYYLDGASDPQAIRVMIVSTLVGGTGSGIVLPVAHYVRHFLKTRFRKSASVIRGFFLLPEIMFGNKSPEERGSLCCNAYAAMRELDAFTRRGDGVLKGTKYDSMRLMMPDSTTSAYVDYDVSPFNFCFLYDKRNTDDLQLVSVVDYKEHAANTIYTQTMSGISSRSNSNEDNAIKSLVSSNGRNRFCGAGSSLLKYPRDDVLAYIADHWCTECMGAEWLTIDNAFKEEHARYKIAKKKNPTEKEPILADFYIQAVENSEKGSFERRLRDMCFETVEDSESDDGLSGVCSVQKFENSLNAHIRRKIWSNPELSSQRDEIQKKRDTITDSLKKRSDLDKDEVIKRDEFEGELQSLETACSNYAHACVQAAKNVGRSVAMQVFQSADDFTGLKNDSYHMESLMRDEDGLFIHPSAARYFIYKLRRDLQDSLAALNGEGGEGGQIAELSRMAFNPFDNPNTRTIETIEDIQVEGFKYKEGVNKALNGIKKQIEAIEGDMDVGGGNVGYAVALAQKAVFEAAVEYLKHLGDAFEAFYKNVDLYMERTKNEAAEIERKYVNGEGKATRYVCASKTCLQQMLAAMPCQSENINGELSATIFQVMKEFAMLADSKQPNPSNYFAKLYDNDIMGYWRSTVENIHAQRINMDILTALEAEATYENDEGLVDDQKTQYLARILEQAERLAAPFIEEPMGEVRHPFQISAYNPVVEGEPDSTRRTFVKKYLQDERSGQKDDNVSPYELMFYRAVYDIGAGDLGRFRPGGVYYKAYNAVYRQLGPDTTKNRVLTPHLDRHWHLTKYMPDLNDENQEILESRIYTALAWGMLTGMIRQEKRTSSVDGVVSIRYAPYTSNDEANKFVVPNGTPCDQLYEVVDALEINPPQVTAILDELENTLEREVNGHDQLLIGETKLINSMNWKDKNAAIGNFDEIDPEKICKTTPFVLKQYAAEQSASMFDLLYWMNQSTPVSDRDEIVITSALNSMVAMLEDYVAQFEQDESECYERCFEMLKDQFALFLDNLMDPSVKRPAPSRRIKDKIVSTIAVALDRHIRNTYNLEPRFDGTIVAMLTDAQA